MPVYFIQAVDDQYGPVKIGYAADVHRRLIAIQTGSPLRLRIVAVMDGAQETEAAMHIRHRAARIDGGEWFRFTADIAADIAANPFRDVRSTKRAKGTVSDGMTHRDIIGLWPTCSACSRSIGLPEQNARKWAERNSIPVEYWRALIAAAAEMGVPLTVENFMDGVWHFAPPAREAA
jgi:hypothetical protein